MLFSGMYIECPCVQIYLNIYSYLEFSIADMFIPFFLPVATHGHEPSITKNGTGFVVFARVSCRGLVWMSYISIQNSLLCNVMSWNVPVIPSCCLTHATSIPLSLSFNPCTGEFTIVFVNTG